MKIDLNYVNSLTISEPTEVKTKENKTFYHQKLVIKGKNEIITLILKSSKILYHLSTDSGANTAPVQSKKGTS